MESTEEDLEAVEDIWAVVEEEEDTWAEPRTMEDGRIGAGEVMDPGLEAVEEAAPMAWGELEGTRDGEVLEVREAGEDRGAGEEHNPRGINSNLSRLEGEAGLVILGSQVKRRSSRRGFPSLTCRHLAVPVGGARWVWQL